jgi:hypothetical protein
MKHGYKKPKTTETRLGEDSLEACSRLSRRYFNLEDGIRRDRARIERLNAQIRQIDRQIADIEAEDHNPRIVTPGFSLSRDKRPRLSLNPSSWAAEQGAEILAATQAQADARQEIARLQAQKRRFQYERDHAARLKADSEAGKAKVLEDMRDLDCPAAGSTNF